MLECIIQIFNTLITISLSLPETLESLTRDFSAIPIVNKGYGVIFRIKWAKIKWPHTFAYPDWLQHRSAPHLYGFMQRCIKRCRTHLCARNSLSLPFSLFLLRLSYKSQQFLGLGLSDERRAIRQSPVAPRGPITRRPWYTTTKDRRKPLHHPLPPSRGDLPVSTKSRCCHLRKWSTSATTEKKSGNLHPLEISRKALSLKDSERFAWWIPICIICCRNF